MEIGKNLQNLYLALTNTLYYVKIIAKSIWRFCHEKSLRAYKTMFFEISRL